MTEIVDAIVEAAADLSDRQFAVASVRLCERAVDTVIASFDRSAVGGNLSKAIGAHLACYWDAIELMESNDNTDPGSVGAVLKSLHGAGDFVQSLMGIRCVSDVAYCVEDAGLSVLGLLCRSSWSELVSTPRTAFEHAALSYSSAARCMSTELREASVRGVSHDRKIMMSEGGNRLRCTPLWNDSASDRNVELRTTVPSAWELRFVSNNGVSQAAMHVIGEAVDVAPCLGSKASMLARYSANYIAEMALCSLHGSASDLARQFWGAIRAWEVSEAHCGEDDGVSIRSIVDVVKYASSAIALCHDESREAKQFLQGAAMGLSRLLKALDRDNILFINTVRSICRTHSVR